MNDATVTIEEDAALGPRLDAMSLRPGARLGRYVVRGRLGQGGMSVVYEGHDPDLDRRVAIKVLLNERGRAPSSERQRRIVAEARAAAAVTHPNVVRIFDIGVEDDLVYIAMELVAQTLDEWIATARPRWPAIVDKYVESARGLAAAHERGIVHRDFKPSNVLVCEDGRARVADFGLALRMDSLRTPASLEDVDGPDEPGGTTRLTRAGGCVGTPAYMPPEQFRGETLDPRADQFAFFVALYRSLYRRAPFPGACAAQLRAAVHKKEPLAPPPDAGVPTAVWRVIARGLSREPDRRWPSMRAVIRRLRGIRTRRPWFAAAAMAIGATALLLGPLAGASDEACTGGEAAMDAAWSEDHEADIQRVVAEARAPAAKPAWRRATTTLDAYRDGWLQAFRKICTSDPSVDPESFDAQMMCLDGQRAELEALVDSAATGDTADVLRLADAAASLPAPVQCADATYAVSLVKPPESATDRAAIDALRRRLARIAGQRERGEYPEAKKRADRVAAEADRIAFAPLVARAQLEVGRLAQLLGNAGEADDALQRAYFTAAEAGRRDVELDAALQLVGLQANELADAAAARRWFRLASAVAEHDGNPAARVRVALSRAQTDTATGDWDTAIVHARDAVELSERILGDDDRLTGDAHHTLGIMHLRQSRFDDADVELTLAKELRQATLGPDHPSVASSHNALGVLANERGQAGEDVRHYERAILIYEQAYGPDHPRLGVVLQNLANATFGRDDMQAQVYLGRALKLRAQIHGEDSPALAGLHVAIGNGYKSAHESELARKHYERAIELAELAGGSAGALPYFELSQNSWHEGDCDAGLETMRHALELASSDATMAASTRARAEFAAAKLLWDCSAEDAESALQMAASARAVFEELALPDFVLSVDEWMEHRRPAGAKGGPW